VTSNSDQQELRRRAFLALKELLARLSDRQPLVLAIDDLQWGDLDSAALLSELLQPPDPPILLLIGVHRSEYADSSPGLARLLAAPAGAQEGSLRESLEIEPLTEEESRRLALGLLEPGSPETAGLAEAIARESGGVPYFVHELVEYVRGGAALTRRLSSDQPISLEQVLMERVDGLPESTRSLLEVIAVSGRPLRQRDVYRAAALPSADPTALSTLTKGHMVKSTGPSERDTVEAYHDRIREAVVARLGAETRVRHHRNLAVTLEAAGGYDPETLAVHMAGAGESGKAGAYYATAAGAAAAALAFERRPSPSFLEPPGDRRRPRLKTALATRSPVPGARPCRSRLPGGRKAQARRRLSSCSGAPLTSTASAATSTWAVPPCATFSGASA
jgi:predicted ATPase